MKKRTQWKWRKEQPLGQSDIYFPACGKSFLMKTVSCHYAKTHHKNKCLREAVVYYHWQHWRATANTDPSGHT